MFCRNCGNDVTGKNYCPNCGTKCYSVNNVNTYNANNDGEGILVGSVIIGFVSIFLIFCISFLAIPIAIVGLIFGIIAYKRCKRIVGIVINGISILLNILFTLIVVIFVGIFVGSFIDFFSEFDNDYYDSETVVDTEDTYLNNPFIGVWDCVYYPDGVDEDFVASMVITDDGRFEWNKYDDRSGNHFYGYYVIKNLDKTNNSGEYKYYSLEVDIYEVIFDDEIQDLYKYDDMKFEIGIANIDGVKQAIMLNYANYNMNYCYLR